MSLKDRFPTLFYDIVDERDAETSEVEELRVERATLPTLRDFIAQVLQEHKVTDLSVVSDLTQTVEQFFAEHVAAITS